MKKYIILGLIIAVVLIGGAIVLISTTETSNNTVLGATSAYAHIVPDQFNKAIASGKFTLIDIRTIDEFNAGHIKTAKQSDYYQTQAFSDYLNSLNKNANYLIYCHTGRRSNLALQIMQQKGFTTVYDLASGYAAWIAAGYPVEK